ncbi:uncharacterized protein LOC123381375 [Felis catus]|uniref:uncharacterized protein LOC123381375 n=1 Tax=Felis catus TaxID=9685 RepID=UPI001D19C407|nr:uncharacterized protein LOC123381375 [Felis catus]
MNGPPGQRGVAPGPRGSRVGGGSGARGPALPAARPEGPVRGRDAGGGGVCKVKEGRGPSDLPSPSWGAGKRLRAASPPASCLPLPGVGKYPEGALYVPHRPLTSPGCVPGAVTLGCDHKDEEESVGELQGQRLGWETGPCVLSVRSPPGPRDLSPEKWKPKELRPERGRALTAPRDGASAWPEGCAPGAAGGETEAQRDALIWPKPHEGFSARDCPREGPRIGRVSKLAGLVYPSHLLALLRGGKGTEPRSIKRKIFKSGSIKTTCF